MEPTTVRTATGDGGIKAAERREACDRRRKRRRATPSWKHDGDAAVKARHTITCVGSTSQKCRFGLAREKRKSVDGRS